MALQEDLFPQHANEGVDDVVIIGGSLAALFCALKLAPRRVTLLTASPIEFIEPEELNFVDIAASALSGQSVEAYISDTLAKGAGIADENIVRLMLKEASGVFHDLLDYDDNDEPTGSSLLQALIRAVRDTPSIRLMENYIAEELQLDGKRITGVFASPVSDVSSHRLLLPAQVTIITTSSVCQLYDQSNPSLREEGLGMAARAGAVIADPEFVEFNSTKKGPISGSAYHVGGIVTDANGRTSLDGLYACGSVASTGVNGAGLVTSNVLIEPIVFASRIAADVLNHYPLSKVSQVLERPLSGDHSDLQEDQFAKLRLMMSTHVANSRDKDGLATALQEIVNLEQDCNSLRLLNILAVAKLIATAAYLREESRGVHQRNDFPEPVDGWQKRTFITLDQSNEITNEASK